MENVNDNINAQSRGILNSETDFYRILETLYDDFTIISPEGIIESALPSFESMYGIPIEEAIGHSIFEMEERKIFDPCISAIVLRTLKPATMLQHTGNDNYLMCTSIPIFNDDGSLHKIISYTRNAEKYEQLKDEYDDLQNTLAAYSAELISLRQKLNGETTIVGVSPRIQELVNMALKVAGFDATVLITGESGVGKNLFVDIIHRNSKRSGAPIISINCGAIPEQLLESELFGYEKGAFTGAGSSGKAGLIELADGGTLFLDEIGEMPLHMQVKLLKVIQEKKVMPVGGLREKPVDFRLIAATNCDLAGLIKEGRFREDLYYRLNVLELSIPPLRQRKEDIIHLVSHFTKKFCEQYGVSHTFSSGAIDCMESYDWPGNVRELENIVERAVLTCDDFTITEKELPSHIHTDELQLALHSESTSLKGILNSVEKAVLVKNYEKYKTTTGVARALGISQPTASQKLSKYLGKDYQSDK